MSNLTSKVALVTGSSGGIGRSTALEFANRGADLVIQYNKNEDEAKNVAQEIGRLGRTAVLAQVDFSNFKASPKMVQEMVDLAVSRLGRVDILVNLAGYPAKGEWKKSLLDLTPDDFLKPIYVDLFGSFLCSRILAPQFLKQKSGVIVNVSSTPALSGHDRGFAFTVAKAGVIGLTLSAAATYAPRGIRVNCVAPGLIRTPMTARLTGNEASLKASTAMHALGRIGEPADVAAALEWLLSPEQSWVTGQVLGIDGGLSTVRPR